MKRINYHYTNIAKQIFILTCFLYVFMRSIIMAEIVVFKIDKYYEATNIPLTLILYLLLFIVVIVLFLGHKVCYSQYDTSHLTYVNRLLRKSKTLDLSIVKTAIFDTRGVYFYNIDVAANDKDKAIFFLPFFRDGIIEAVQINGFFKMIKNNENINVIKNFKVLPGYSKKWRWVTILYGFLAVCVFANCSTPLYVIIVLFQNH